MRNRRRIDHKVSTFDIGSLVLREHANSKTLEVIDHGTFARVGTAHDKTIRMEHLGNAGHSRTADTDKVKLADTLAIINLH